MSRGGAHYAFFGRKKFLEHIEIIQRSVIPNSSTDRFLQEAAKMVQKSTSKLIRVRPGVLVNLTNALTVCPDPTARVEIAALIRRVKR